VLPLLSKFNAFDSRFSFFPNPQLPGSFGKTLKKQLLWFQSASQYRR